MTFSLCCEWCHLRCKGSDPAGDLAPNLNSPQLTSELTCYHVGQQIDDLAAMSCKPRSWLALK
eukprot:m.4888 g.4888  ORF g.4888 m.4888 type:complete len:63 (-) comp3795_c0_seq1:40-228(-)